MSVIGDWRVPLPRLLPPLPGSSASAFSTFLFLPFSSAEAPSFFFVVGAFFSASFLFFVFGFVVVVVVVVFFFFFTQSSAKPGQSVRPSSPTWPTSTIGTPACRASRSVSAAPGARTSRTLHGRRSSSPSTATAE